MLLTQKNILYRAFGLNIVSEIELPELNIENNNAPIDIEVKLEDLSELWSSSGANSDFIIKNQFVMFKAYDIAIFSIVDGKKISVSPLEGFDEDKVRLWILGTCMGALLLQREIIPLHGSAVVIDGKAYAIVGDSGAGKSTLASAFIKNGYRLLTDDVIAVTLDKKNAPIVTPSYPQQKLWQDSIESFGLECKNYKSIHGRETKFYIPMSSSFYNASVPLAGVIELFKSENDVIEMKEIDSLNRFYTLYSNTFRNFLIRGLGLMQWHFDTCAIMVNQINFFRLQRPISGYNAQQIVDTILPTLLKGSE
ncbi:ATPase domain-containing protein [Mesobacillus jeotgali]|uniref:ATPase domain-containing protein n=1 Tax=Mesobacillus jeotgali TaxID=129985 RepID=UPI001CFF30EB|nr:ATPase domain-containing protein [Mesobacillus jeotgali]